MVTVRLILYGLIAFVPNSNGSPTAYNALLVDARGPQYASDGCRIPPHVSALYALAGRCKVDGAACTMSSEVEKPWSPALSGSWLLNRESLSIEVMAPHEKRARKLVAVGRQPATSALTAKSEESNSLRWIPDMQTLLAPEGKKASVSPDCLAAARSCPITARLTIDDGRFISCHLAQGAEKGVYPYEFKLPEAGAQPVLVQAMSDAVMVTLEVPQGSKVQIVPRDLSIQSAKAKPKRTIELADGGQKEIDIWLTNAPDHHHMMDEDSCDGANMRIDRHFELYYNLLSGPVPFKQRVCRPKASLRPLENQLQPCSPKERIAVHCSLFSRLRARAQARPIALNPEETGIPQT